MDGSNHLKTILSNKNPFYTIYISTFFHEFVEIFIYYRHATLIYSDHRTLLSFVTSLRYIAIISNDQWGSIATDDLSIDKRMVAKKTAKTGKTYIQVS